MKCCGNCAQRRDVPETDRMFGTGFIGCTLKPAYQYVSPTRGTCDRHQQETKQENERQDLAALF